MNKYGIDSAGDLYRVFKRLIMMGVIDLNQIRYRLPEGWRAKLKRYDPPALGKGESSRKYVRQRPRKKLFGKIEIYEAGTCGEGYQILDVSEAGLLIAGIKTWEGDVKELTIPAINFDDVQPISFSAECRWLNTLRAGFRIIRITPGNLAELKKFMHVFTFEGL
ncbi:MAG: PilZ domain-containing protein [Desulfomonile tiedjei]|nr:PilZ domain-containing protein [Desulfomonile tiedjei]